MGFGVEGEVLGVPVGCGKVNLAEKVDVGVDDGEDELGFFLGHGCGGLEEKIERGGLWLGVRGAQSSLIRRDDARYLG